MRGISLSKYVQQLLQIKQDANIITKSSVFANPLKQSGINPFGKNDPISPKDAQLPVLSKNVSKSIILSMDDQMLFEEEAYDKKLIDESSVPFTELRLSVYDIIKTLVYTQCEIYEFASVHYDRLIKKLCLGVMQIFEKGLNSVTQQSISKAAGLQMLFEFDYLLECFKEIVDLSEISTKIHKTLWKIIAVGSKSGSAPEITDEKQILSESEIEEKTKQLKVLKYKSSVTLQSFIS